MVQINWTADARADLKEIKEYISAGSVRFAQLQIAKVKSRTKILKRHPRIGQVIKAIGREEIRQLVEGNYIIIYKIKSPSRIDILLIHHASRNLRRRLE